MVMVRISSCSVRTMVMVSRISSPEKLRCRIWLARSLAASVAVCGHALPRYPVHS